MKRLYIIAICAIALTAFSQKPDRQKEVQSFLDSYNQKYRELYTASSLGQWKVNTYIVENDTINSYRSRMADEALVAFTGSKENIEKARAYLKWKSQLNELQVRQLNKILFMAAGAPQSVEKDVKQLIRVNNAQTEKLYGYKFLIDGLEVTPNDINHVLNSSKNLDERLKAWEASKEIGKVLKPGLIEQRALRNKTVQALGYKDFFSYMVSEYGMSRKEMMAMLEKFNKELYPLYRELHTYARYELASKYGKPVPDMIPAHWLTNKWGQDWNEMINVKGFNLDSALSTKSAEWVAKQVRG